MRVLIFIALTFSATVFLSCRPAAEPLSISDKPISIYEMRRSNSILRTGKAIQQLGWTLLANEKEELIGEYKGKILVLDFWATYCPPCIEEIPHLNALRLKYKDRGLEIIGLNVGGDEDKPRIPAFRNRIEIDYPIAYPEEELTFALLGQDNRIPQTLIFDRNGKLLRHFISYDETVKRAIDETISSAFVSESSK